MTKSNIITLISLIIIVGGLIFLARPESRINNTATLSQNATGTKLEIMETKFDFGSISMASGKVNHEFVVKNTSDKETNISKLYTSCMCTSATLIKNGKRFGPYGMPGHGFVPRTDEVLAPGESATVEVTFDPSAHGPAGVGRIERVVTIEQNDEQISELNFVATVTP